MKKQGLCARAPCMAKPKIVVQIVKQNTSLRCPAPAMPLSLLHCTHTATHGQVQHKKKHIKVCCMFDWLAEGALSWQWELRHLNVLALCSCKPDGAGPGLDGTAQACAVWVLLDLAAALCIPDDNEVQVSAVLTCAGHICPPDLWCFPVQRAWLECAQHFAQVWSAVQPLHVSCAASAFVVEEQHEGSYGLCLVVY